MKGPEGAQPFQPASGTQAYQGAKGAEAGRPANPLQQQAGGLQADAAAQGRRAGELEGRPIPAAVQNPKGAKRAGEVAMRALPSLSEQTAAHPKVSNIREARAKLQAHQARFGDKIAGFRQQIQEKRAILADKDALKAESKNRNGSAARSLVKQTKADLEGEIATLKRRAEAHEGALEELAQGLRNEIKAVLEGHGLQDWVEEFPWLELGEGGQISVRDGENLYPTHMNAEEMREMLVSALRTDAIYDAAVPLRSTSPGTNADEKTEPEGIGVPKPKPPPLEAIRGRMGKAPQSLVTQKFLAKGGGGEVYKAFDLLTNQFVAVKWSNERVDTGKETAESAQGLQREHEVSHQLQPDPANPRRGVQLPSRALFVVPRRQASTEGLVDQAKAGGKEGPYIADHPKHLVLVAPLYTEGSLDGAFEMEGDVAVGYKEGREPPTEIKLKYAEDVFLGAGHLNTEKLFHGDVKPANLFVGNGRCDISDFDQVYGTDPSFIDDPLFEKPPAVTPGQSTSDDQQWFMKRIHTELKTRRDQETYPTPEAQIAADPDYKALFEAYQQMAEDIHTWAAGNCVLTILRGSGEVAPSPWEFRGEELESRMQEFNEMRTALKDLQAKIDEMPEGSSERGALQACKDGLEGCFQPYGVKGESFKLTGLKGADLQQALAPLQRQGVATPQEVAQAIGQARALL